MLIASLLLSTTLIACESQARTPEAEKPPIYTNYRDIPGITEEETAAVEKLREKYDSFVYGANLSTENFYDDDGKLSGFVKLNCDWLSELFGIEFRPRVYEWGNLIAGLEDESVQFTGELTPSPERQKNYFMTGAIAERTIKYMQLQGSENLSVLAEKRKIRCAFLSGTTTIDLVTPQLSFAYKLYEVEDYDTAHQMLAKGEIDIFIEEGVAEAAFDSYGDIVAYDFFPPIYESVSLSTQNEELQPVISVIQKALQNGAMRHLLDMYNAGEQEYRKHKLDVQLTPEEKRYIKTHIKNDIPIKFAAEYDNYPICFYNAEEDD
jgi:ABC-type amino acid transport substrate-binding protein